MLPLFLILLGQFLSLAQKVTESTLRYYQACKRGAEIRHRRKLLGKYSRGRRRAHRNMLLSLGVSSGVLLQIHAARIKRRCWVYPRTAAWWEQFVRQVWSDRKWLEYFRMTRGTFQHLADELRPVLQRQHTAMRVPISVEKRLAIALWWLATNCCSRALGELFGVGRSSAAQITIEVCLAIESHLFRRTVRLGDMQEAIDGFGQLGLPHCVGAVGGTRINVLVPCRQGTDFSNQKNYFSVLLQAAVDPRGHIWHVEVGYSGKNDESFAFGRTALCAAMESGTLFSSNPTMNIRGVQVPPFLVGDSTYPLKKWLLKPYGGHLNAVQTHFNAHLSRARSAVERCFGRIKKRWCCLQETLHVEEVNINSVIAACVVLHNICEAKDGPLASWDTDTLVAGNSSAKGENRRSGEEAKRVRDAVAQFMWEKRERNQSFH